MLSLSIRDLHCWHGTNSVLNGLDLEVESNSLCCIVGPSGAGKTTLLKIIVGQCDASRGSVEWGGKDIKSLGSKERATAMVYQNYALFPHLTVWENVTFGLEDEGLSTVVLKQRALDALKMVDAREWAQKRPQELSGGQQQRVALARALAQQPKLLLLDEPLSNLDAVARVELRQRLQRLVREQNLTILCVLHDQKDALAIADTIGVMQAGKIIQAGRPLDVYRRPLNSWLATFLGSANLFKGKILRTGAGEFMASTAIGEVRGALATPAQEPVEGSEITICIRPECLRLDSLPPEENAFSGKIIDSVFQGDFSLHQFKTDSGVILKTAEINPRQSVGSKALVYAWAEPEDVVGLLD